MYYDLNIPWSANHAELERTLRFLHELSYGVVALNELVTGRLPGTLSCAIPDPLPFAVPPGLRVLRRVTVVLSDATQNHRLPALAAHYDLVAVRPTDEKTLAAACASLDCDLVSLDLSRRYPFFFKLKTINAAVARGVRVELAYAQALLAVGSSTGGVDPNARRNVIANATGLVRAARRRGIVIASEASRALACRAPADVVNLAAAVWGLGSERGHEAVEGEARSVVVQAEMRRRSFRGVVDVVYGGEKPVAAAAAGAAAAAAKKKKDGGTKRKAEKMEGGGGGEGSAGGGGGPPMGGEVTLSKREKKRRAKQERDRVKGEEEDRQRQQQQQKPLPP